MVSNQQFRLKWNNHRNTVLQEFETLLHNNNFVDCTIGAEGKYLKAHKIVLSACSPYLQNVFNEHFDKHPVILLKDVSFKELKCMIDYMYCGEVNISECELPSFLRTAQSLKIKGLAEDIGDYDSASDSEHQEITNSYCGSNRSVEPNVEIHDDEPPAKKSAPSLISTNANNNSFSGRKRKTASSFPTTSKTSVDSQIIEKSAAVQITSQSRKLLEISSTNESENHVKVVPSSTTTIENSINKSENTECDKKIVTPSDPLEDKTKHFKEEPIDMDADNEDNSSYEYGNNPCDEIDALNEDSESNCATSGNKFGDVSIGNVSSYSENDANDDVKFEGCETSSSAMLFESEEMNSMAECLMEQIDDVDTKPYLPTHSIISRQISEGLMAAQYITPNDDDLMDSNIVVEVKTLYNDVDESSGDCDQSSKRLAVSQRSYGLRPRGRPKGSVTRSLREPVERATQEKSLVKEDDVRQFRKILPAPAKQGSVLSTPLVSLSAVNQPPNLAKVKFTMAPQVMPIPPAVADPIACSQGVANEQQQPPDLSKMNSPIFVLNASSNSVMLLGSQTSPASTSSAGPVYRFASPVENTCSTRVHKNVTLAPATNSNTKKASVPATRPKRGVLKNVISKFRKIAPLVNSAPTKWYRCSRCCTMFHNEGEFFKHDCGKIRLNRKHIVEINAGSHENV